MNAHLTLLSNPMSLYVSQRNPERFKKTYLSLVGQLIYDDFGNRLVEVSKPCPPEEAFKPRIPQGENEFVPWLV